MNQGIPLNKTYNAPGKITITSADGGEDWASANYGDAGQGTLDLVQATTKSSNTAYAQLMHGRRPRERGGPRQAHGHHLRARPGARRSSSAPPTCRCSTWPRPTRPSPTTASTAPAYVVSKVTDAYGNVLYEHEVKGDKVLDEKVAQAGQLHPQPGGRGRHRHRRQDRPAGRRARRAPPRSTATPGSSATRASSPPRSGWATPTSTPTADPVHEDRPRQVGHRRLVPGHRSGSKYM